MLCGLSNSKILYSLFSSFIIPYTIIINFIYSRITALIYYIRCPLNYVHSNLIYPERCVMLPINPNELLFVRDFRILCVFCIILPKNEQESAQLIVIAFRHVFTWKIKSSWRRLVNQSNVHRTWTHIHTHRHTHAE